MKERLKVLTLQEITQQGIFVQKQILSSSIYNQSQNVAIYISMEKELPTDAIIQDLLRPDSGKRCFVPYIDKKIEKLRMLEVISMSDFQSFQKNKWGIFEPPDPDSRRNAVGSGILDLIITPGIAFTKEGYRCGYGKGYYDKTFEAVEKELQAKGKKRPYYLGVCLSVQIVDEVPLEPFDKKMDCVIHGGQGESHERFLL
eukprot:TRINITY_DN5444_c0_g1_i1.p1 TRINITY_DN5444_c0_g1~~TRINITY_DN5444_c0_g1_i1.p1  ORF type:complete len:220 (-),score=38.62 TRINITY_DN5444_c0_g1_i1:68-667(-)